MGIVTSLTNGLSEREANDALNAHVSVPPPPKRGEIQPGRNSSGCAVGVPAVFSLFLNLSRSCERLKDKTWQLWSSFRTVFGSQFLAES